MMNPKEEEEEEEEEEAHIKLYCAAHAAPNLCK